jgi:hypothetical protein
MGGEQNKPKVEPVTIGGGVNFTDKDSDGSQDIAVTDAFISALSKMSSQQKGEFLAHLLPDIIGGKPTTITEPVDPQKGDYKARYVRSKDGDWGHKNVKKNWTLANGRIVSFRTNIWQRVAEDDYRELSRSGVDEDSEDKGATKPVYLGFFETAAPWEDTPEDFLPETKECWARSKVLAESREKKKERDRQIAELQKHIMGTSSPDSRDKFFKILMDSAMENPLD